MQRLLEETLRTMGIISFHAIDGVDGRGKMTFNPFGHLLDSIGKIFTVISIRRIMTIKYYFENVQTHVQIK